MSSLFTPPVCGTSLIALIFLGYTLQCNKCIFPYNPASFCLPKDTVKRMKIQAIDWKKVLAKFMSIKISVPKTHKELLKGHGKKSIQYKNRSNKSENITLSLALCCTTYTIPIRLAAPIPIQLGSLGKAAEIDPCV